jgi:hypothetical protein
MDNNDDLGCFHLLMAVIALPVYIIAMPFWLLIKVFEAILGGEEGG